MKKIIIKIKKIVAIVIVFQSLIGKVILSHHFVLDRRQQILPQIFTLIQRGQILKVDRIIVKNSNSFLLFRK